MKRFLCCCAVALQCVLSGCPAGPSDSAKEKTSMPAVPDTGHLRRDLDTLIGAATASGRLPDTTKVKAAGADVLRTTAGILSDSGIDHMGGADNNDAGVKQAKQMFKKMRDSMGLSPALLDQMKKDADKLNSGNH